MKLFTQLPRLKFISFLMLALLANPVFSKISGEKKMISQSDQMLASEQIIYAFAQASDSADADALELILHPDFRVVFTTKAGASPTTLSRAQYLQMVREGKIGGNPRTVELSEVSVTSGFAITKATMTRPDAVFTGVYSLIEQENGRWLLLEEAVLMSVKEMKK
jgi:ketosteroid isomerase-like protein